MLRSAFIAVIAVLLLAQGAMAGFSSYKNPYSSDSVVAPIQIKDKGIYNLVVAIQFLNEPYDEKVYKSDAYEDYLRRLKVEWSGVALTQILSAEEQSINDLASLKAGIEAEIAELAERLKKEYSLADDVEVIFSLSNFFLLEPEPN